MTREENEIGHGAEALIAIAIIKADEERRRVLELPPMRVVVVLPNIERHLGAIRRHLSVITSHGLESFVEEATIKWVPADALETNRGLRCDVVIALRGYPAEHEGIVDAWLLDYASLGIQVIR